MTARLQGTDGVRSLTALSTDDEVVDLSPQDAFIKKGLMTEEFVELYLFCRVRQLFESGLVKDGDSMAVGWDPRDPSGVFTNAAISGIVKGGLHAEVLGVAPTPAIPIFMQSNNLAAGAVVTASHNPAVFNGVKLFTKRGLKLFPTDDIALTELIHSTDYKSVKNAAPKGEIRDRKKEWLQIFIDFHLDKKNSWIEDPSKLANITLVLDTANGALSEVAPVVCKKAGFGTVIACNTSLDGAVNLRSGVGDLEGMHEIIAEMIEDGGLYQGYEAIETVFLEGRKKHDEIIEGKEAVSLALFDGDGDRLMRGDYNSYNDSINLIGGDEISVHLASMKNEPGKLFVNTVESDQVVSAEATAKGCQWEVTAVGDKWILLTAILSLVQAATEESVFESVCASALSTEPSADEIETALNENNVSLTGEHDIPFCVGAEESGHIITPGYLKAGITLTGNGLKSCLNTHAFATSGPLSKIEDSKERFYSFINPYPRGFKKSLYVYHVDKSRFTFGSEVWKEVRDVIVTGTYRYWSAVSLRAVNMPQEPNMLYLQIVQGKEHVASIFIRNSGTEDKIGVGLRGKAANRNRLLHLGEEAVRALLLRMKDHTKKSAVAEREVLEQAKENGAPADAINGIAGDEYLRLLNEASLKQGLIDKPLPGAKLTKRGEWYLSTLKAMKK